jgi:mono/diheme cytochrome c family protein
MHRPSVPTVCLAVIFGAALGLLHLGWAPASADESEGAAPEGAALYEANCVKCHGADGKADTPVGRAMKAVSLVDPKWSSEGSADAVVAGFRENPKHKAVASKVSDDDLRAIAVYLHKLASAG